VDLQPIHGDDVGTGSRTGQAGREGVVELLVVVRDVDADGQAAEDEEGRQAVEDGAVGARHHHARVLRLARRHADVVRPRDREAGLDQALQEAEEAAEGARLVQFGEGTGVLPVAEAEPVVQRVAAQHGDEGVQDQADDQDDFAEREPEFGFAVPFDGEDVDQSVEGQMPALVVCIIYKHSYERARKGQGKCATYPYRTMTMAMMPPAGTAVLQ